MDHVKGFLTLPKIREGNFLVQEIILRIPEEDLQKEKKIPLSKQKIGKKPLRNGYRYIYNMKDNNDTKERLP